MTVSLYNDEYVERIEEDRDDLISLLLASVDEVLIEGKPVRTGEVVFGMNSTLPLRRNSERKEDEWR